MPQFRFKAVNPRGKFVQGEFEAPDKKSAQAKVDLLAKNKRLQIQSLDQKQTFLYKVRKNGGKPITGKQEAYVADELENALDKLGYDVIRVQKKLFTIKGSVPTDEVVSFVRLAADLLRQQLRFDEILRLIGEDVSNKRMRETLKQIEKDLKEGKDGREVYGKHQNIFGKFATYMLSVASTSGNMAEVFESTAKFLERDSEFRKSLRKSLLMPLITLVAVLGVVLAYVGYIFPKTAELFVKFDIALPPMTAVTLDISHFLQIHWIGIGVLSSLPVIAAILLLKTPKGRLWFDKTILNIPVIGGLLHKTSIEIFARVFYTLYSGSGENVDVIRVASEACRNTYVEQQIKGIAIPMMLKEGKGLIESLEATGVFPKTAISRFRLGAESGALKENSKQLAEYYELQTSYKMDATITSINVAISFFIMVIMVALTVVSSETAVINPTQPM